MIALFQFTARQLLLQRKIWLTLGLIAFPAVVFIVVRSLLSEAAPLELWTRYHGLLLHLLLTLILPLVCMLYGLSLLGSEIEQRTLVYLTTRRLRRGTVLLVRFLATWVTVTIVLQAGVLLYHYALVGGVDLQGALPPPASPGYQLHKQVADNWQPGKSLAAYLGIMPLGAAAYLAVFTLLSLLARRPLAMSITYIAVVELLIGSIPLPIRRISVIHHIRQSATYSIPGVRRILDLPPDAEDLLYPLTANGADNLVWIAVAVVVAAAYLATTRELAPPRALQE